MKLYTFKCNRCGHTETCETDGLPAEWTCLSYLKKRTSYSYISGNYINMDFCPPCSKALKIDIIKNKDTPAPTAESLLVELLESMVQQAVEEHNNGRD